MHYVAWVMAQGGVPYRDVFDMNMPGVYLIHLAVLTAAGPGDLAWRLFDLGWLAATGALLWVYARPLGRAPAAAGALLFALYHLSGGAWRSGQRDFLLCAFLLAGVYGVARCLERGGAVRPLLWAGLALGAGVMVKPHAGLLWLGLVGFTGWVMRASGRSAALTAALVATGLVVPAAVLGWLAWRGGLRPFIDILTGYVLPLYSQVGRVPVWQAFGWYHLGWTLWAVLGALALLALATPAPAGTEARRALAGLGAIYGWLHFQLQGKGWEYQLYPLALFLCALIPFALHRLAAGPGRRAALGLALARPIALALLVAAVAVLGVKAVDALDAPWIDAKARRVSRLTGDLARLAPPGATVQVMDVTEGGVHALLNLGRREPTRFIYDFHFFHHEADPRIQALRNEFVRDVAAGRPAAIAVLRDTWNRGGYERLRDWPEMAALLQSRYALAVDGDGYRIYAKRPDP
jgi:hypothetical protein